MVSLWMDVFYRPHSFVRYCRQDKFFKANPCTIWTHIQYYKLRQLLHSKWQTQLQFWLLIFLKTWFIYYFFQFWYFSRANGLAVKVWIHSGSSPASLATGSPKGSSNVLVQESCVWSILKPNWHGNRHCLLSHSVLGEC